MNHIPRGLCVIINNEEFLVEKLKKRVGTQVDESAYFHQVTRRMNNVILLVRIAEVFYSEKS